MKPHFPTTYYKGEVEPVYTVHERGAPKRITYSLSPTEPITSGPRILLDDAGNTKRAADCWNACEGIEDPLEVVPRLYAGARWRNLATEPPPNQEWVLLRRVDGMRLIGRRRSSTGELQDNTGGALPNEYDVWMPLP